MRGAISEPKRTRTTENHGTLDELVRHRTEKGRSRILTRGVKRSRRRRRRRRKRRDSQENRKDVSVFCVCSKLQLLEVRRQPDN